MMNQEHKQASDADGFDSFLRSQLQQAQPYLMDDDFTTQVMAQLPAPKKLARWQEWLIMLVPVVAITLLVLSQFSLLALGVQLWTWLVALNVTSLLQMGLAMMLCAIAGASVWVIKQSRVF